MKLTLDEKISAEFLKFLHSNQLELGNDFTIVEVIPPTDLPINEQTGEEVVHGRFITTSFYKVMIETTLYGFINYGRLLERFHGPSLQA